MKEPVKGLDKDVCGAKLLLTTVFAYPVNCVTLFLSPIEDTALLSVS